MPVLTSTAGLPDKLALRLRTAANALPICHLRLADIRLNRELSLHSINDDIEVKFSHPADDRLSRFFLDSDSKRRVLIS